MVHAVALENWQRMHRFCSRCGERTTIAAAGHVRRCPACAAEHYPRTDPAVIMLVTDDQDRALLGRQMHWPAGRFSTLAGFVEPGESIEQAVVREVAEEAGVEVCEVELRGQPAVAVPLQPDAGLHGPGRPVRHPRGRRRDPRGPLVLPRRPARQGIESGDMLPPSGISIAARLIELWYGKPLPTAPH